MAAKVKGKAAKVKANVGEQRQQVDWKGLILAKFIF
jgi:hypothetical protein